MHRLFPLCCLAFLLVSPLAAPAEEYPRRDDVRTASEAYLGTYEALGSQFPNPLHLWREGEEVIARRELSDDDIEHPTTRIVELGPVVITPPAFEGRTLRGRFLVIRIPDGTDQGIEMPGLEVPSGDHAGLYVRREVSAYGSSWLPSAKGRIDAYWPPNLLDGDAATAWAEGKPGPGLGESVVLRFRSPRKVTGVRVTNGYGKSAALFRQNGRAKELRIQGDGFPPLVVPLADAPKEQTIPLTLPRPVESLRFEILAVYAGTKFPDTCLSEIDPIFPEE